MNPKTRRVVFWLAAALAVAFTWRGYTSPAFRERYKLVFDELNCLQEFVNSTLDGFAAWEIACISIFVFILTQVVIGIVWQEESLVSRTKKAIFSYAKKIPYVRRMVDAELNKSLVEIEKSMVKHPDNYKVQAILPKTGMTPDEILEYASTLNTLGAPQQRHTEGKVSGTIYVGGPNYEEYTETLTKVYGMFAWSNPLHPGVFPGVRQMEAEVIAVCCKIFNGGPDSCGCVTSGGTESILMAMKAYRDRAREEKGIYRPNLVVARTAHPAFDKACQYFNISIRHIQEDPKTRKADVAAMRRAIDSNTIAIVGSCPQYPFGAVDPIEDLAKVALEYEIGLHVDCCLGSFVVPFMRKAGFTDFPAFDFSVKGVTSISADTHKYGYAPKGSSVVLYNSHDLRHYQYSVFPDWPGGIYGTPNVAGSRPGGLVAATWAALMYHGEKGYIDNCRTVVTLARKVAKEISRIPGLKLVCPPDATVVSWTSDVFDINRMCDGLMEERHWDINVLQFPASMHICITMAHSGPGVIDQFIEDMREVAKPLFETPEVKASGQGAIYGMSQSIPDRSVIAEIVHGYLDASMKVTKSLSGQKEEMGSLTN